MRRAIVGLAAALAVLSAAASAKDELALKPFDAASPGEIKRTLAGRPHLLVFWSLYCDPCREEMPLWGDLQRKYPSVPILLIATDGADERAKVEKFLGQQKLGKVQTWMFADEFVERIRYAVDPTWRGELPRTYFVDAQQRAVTHSGRVDPAQISRWMAQQR
jgi:thiol-disulfide isomerase/thioredoxin